MTTRLSPCRKCGNARLVHGYLFSNDNGGPDRTSGYTIECPKVHMPKKGWDHSCRNWVHGKDLKQARQRWNYLQTVERPKGGGK